MRASTNKAIFPSVQFNSHMWRTRLTHTRKRTLWLYIKERACVITANVLIALYIYTTMYIYKRRSGLYGRLYACYIRTAFRLNLFISFCVVWCMSTSTCIKQASTTREETIITHRIYRYMYWCIHSIRYVYLFTARCACMHRLSIYL